MENGIPGKAAGITGILSFFFPEEGQGQKRKREPEDEGDEDD